MVQVILALIVAAALGAVTFVLYRSRVNRREITAYVQKRQIDQLAELCAKELSQWIRQDTLAGMSDERSMAELKRRRTLSTALDQCIYGVEKYQRLVKVYISEILRKELKDEEECCNIFDFDNPLTLSPNEQWEVLLYLAENRYGSKPMTVLNEKYGFDKPVYRETEDSANKYRYIVDSVRLSKIFKEELGDYKLTYADMIAILTILIYNSQYGFGIVNTIRRLDIDGFNFGTSGSVRYVIDGNFNIPYKTTNSVWIQMNAKWIHFSFLDFGVEAEMKRVINRLVSWGTTAPMTEKSPYKVNDGYDGARVTAIRPPAGESWAIFIRKFSAGLYVKEKLLHKINDKGEDILKNWELPSTLMYYLMRSEQTVPFTGQQNTGKTSMMKAVMADIKMVNIRVLEMSFELALRELYPWKNIITVKPTDYVTSSQLQDLLKKTDGYLSMVGEVAEDIVAARMIQFCLIASAFTIFSHHAKTDEDLINGLANSLVACGEYENHAVAMSTVLDAIKHNVHLDFKKGQRCIAFISEICKLDEIAPYPNVYGTNDVAEAIVQLTRIQKEYYTRTTDRVRFQSRHIIEFNPETMTYEAKSLYTPGMLESILKNLDDEDRKGFIKFYRKNWGHLLNEEAV